MAQAMKMVLHHDDPPCTARLDVTGYCSECKLNPDMQSTAFYYYCSACDTMLKNMQCPKCKKQFELSD